MRSYINYKRPAFWVIVITLVIAAIVICIALSADSEQSGTVSKDNLSYQNEAMGFSVLFPADWAGRYTVKESEETVSVYSTKVVDGFADGGLLFTVSRQVGELITEADVAQAATPQKIVLQGNGYTYFIKTPSDVQFPADDQTLSTEYKALSAEIPELEKSFALVGKTLPTPSNKGYHVVGTSFFTTEIPKGWELAVNDGAPASWDIMAKGKVAGNIALIPYKSEGAADAAALSDNMQREYIYNETAGREARIKLSRDIKDTKTIDNIKKSFAFADGPYNVLDFRSEAAAYLEKGGKQIFGQIVRVNFSDGKPSSVKIYVLKFITGKEAAGEPNGFLIKDTGWRRTVTLTAGTRVAVLAAPDHVNYGLYEMPLLDQSFIDTYKDYKDNYYDFILDSDGHIKTVLGHYIP